MQLLAATVTSKGQITLPVEIRRLWGLEPGDSMEFFSDHLDNWYVRPLNRKPTAFFENLAARSRLPGIASDEDAIAAVMVEKNMRRGARAAA